MVRNPIKIDPGMTFNGVLENYFSKSPPERQALIPGIREKIENSVREIFDAHKSEGHFEFTESEYLVHELNKDTIAVLVVLAAKELHPEFRVQTNGKFIAGGKTAEMTCSFEADIIS